MKGSCRREVKWQTGRHFETESWFEVEQRFEVSLGIAHSTDEKSERLKVDNRLCFSSSSGWSMKAVSQWNLVGL